MKRYVFWILAIPAMLAIHTVANSEVSSTNMTSVTNTDIPTAAHPGRFSVASTNSDLSNVIGIDQWEHFSYQSKCTSSSGTADYKLELLLASTTDPGMFKEISTGDLISSDTTEDWTAPTAISPPVSGYAQFKFTGVNSNPSDTQCWLYFNRERGR